MVFYKFREKNSKNSFLSPVFKFGTGMNLFEIGVNKLKVHIDYHVVAYAINKHTLYISGDRKKFLKQFKKGKNQDNENKEE